MSIYANLANVLADRAGSSWKVAFPELERLIGAKLPASAFKYPAWWSNNPSNNAMTKIWLRAGWRTEQVDIPGQTVVFRRAVVAEVAGAGFGDRARAFEYASTRAPETKMARPPGEEAEAAAIGRRIRAARERAGLSETMLAADLGLDAGAVRRLEAGFGLEALVRMKRMATTLTMSADELLGIGGGAAEDAPKKKPRFEDIYGCMKGTMKIMPGVDLTEPLTEEWEANEAKWEARFADPEFGLSKLSPKTDKSGR